MACLLRAACLCRAVAMPPPQHVTKPGDYQYIVNEGMPVHNSASRGHLFVHYFIDFPKSLTEAQKHTIRELFAAAAA